MATTPNITAVVKDKHSVALYNVADGSFRGTLFVTSGEIIGQPLQSAETLTVTYTEGGSNYMSTYKLPGLQFKSKIKL